MTTSSYPTAPAATPTSPLVGRTADVVLSASRIVIGLLFAQHGAQKLLGWFGGMGPQGGTVPLASLPGVAGVLELVGGLLVAFGLFTRPLAFLLAGEMAVAYFMAHAPQGFWPIQNRGETVILFCFAFLLIWTFGPGGYSLDALLRRRR
jgi:putative oxidoreductase